MMNEKMRSREDVEKRYKEKVKQREYLEQFLGNCFKGSNAKVQIKNELQVLNKEISTLIWVLDDGTLPF